MHYYKLFLLTYDFTINDNDKQNGSCMVKQQLCDGLNLDANYEIKTKI